jgi:hypothetical protein
MKPTPKLRFIERQMEINGDHKLVRILQQWWEDVTYFDMITGKQKGEWRDVPLEQE